MKRSQVIQPILDLFPTPRYLEVGVSSGATFFELRAAAKTAVDPYFRFDLAEARAKETNSRFHAVESDVFFGQAIEPGARFDVIFLDGLHLFEQTLRDFCNAIHFLSEHGVIVVDDIIPNSYASSLPAWPQSVALKRAIGDTDESWMGDVYRLVFFIEAFFQQYQFATVRENHGQLIVWPAQRQKSQLKLRDVEQVARLPFEAIHLESGALQVRPYSEILEMLRAAALRQSGRLFPTRQAGPPALQ